MSQSQRSDSADVSRASAWSLVDILGRQVLQFGFTIALARLLSPADFGIVAIAMLVVGLGGAISEGGVSLALIQRANVTPQHQTASRITNVVLGLSVMTLILILAPTIADVFDQPRVTLVLYIMAPTVLFAALSATPLAMRTRQLDFKLVAVSGLTSAGVSGIAAISLAVAGADVLALAAQPVVAAFIVMVVLNSVHTRERAARPNRSDFTAIWSFGGPVLASTVLEVVTARLYAALIGANQGPRAVGLYGRADQTNQLAANVVGSLITRVSLPILSRHQHEPQAVMSRMKQGAVLAIGINAPIFTLLGALATPTMVTLYGDAWRDAGVILSILCLAGLFFPLQALNVNYVIAVGRPRVYFGLEVTKKAVGIPLLVLGSSHGPTGIAWAYVAYSLVALAINTVPARRWAAFGLAAQLRASGGAIVATAPVGLGLFVLSGWWEVSAPVELLSLGALGIVLMTCAYAIVKPACVVPFSQAFAALLRRRRVL